MGLLRPELLVVVTNYEFNNNAARLKHTLGRYFNTILIDGSSRDTPAEADLVVPNTYYPGLWNAAVHAALERGCEWLWFIASDVRLRSSSGIHRCVNQALDDPRTGVWTPSVHRESRCASKLSITRGTAKVRTCSYVEGFCFMARTSILKQQYPLPARNKSGWGVDVVTSYLAWQQGYEVRVDDRALVHHPRARKDHAINQKAARIDMRRYCRSFGLSVEKIDAFFLRDYEQLKAEGLA